jgi:hypothetical protein
MRYSVLLIFIAVLALLTAVLAIVYRTGRTRAFAVGFVTFGTGFLAVVVFEQIREGSSGGHQMPTSGKAQHSSAFRIQTQLFGLLAQKAQRPLRVLKRRCVFLESFPFWNPILQ